MEAFYAKLEVPPVGKIPVFVRRWGCGAKVLLVHGWMNSSLRWYRLVPFLAAHYEVWALDLPGFGLSPPVPQCHTGLETYSDIVTKLIDEISEGKVLHGLVGHSMGAILSLLILKRAAPAINCIIASGAPVTGVTYLKPLVNRSWIVSICLRILQALAGARMKLTDKRLDFGYRGWGDTAKTNLENRREAHVATAAALLKQICNCNLFADFQSLLGKVTPNLLIVRGQNDPFNSRDDSVQLAQVLGGRFHEFPGARHSPLIEHPENSYPILQQFLEECN